jgi:hypothetical protein
MGVCSFEPNNDRLTSFCLHQQILPREKHLFIFYLDPFYASLLLRPCCLPQLVLSSVPHRRYLPFLRSFMDPWIRSSPNFFRFWDRVYFLVLEDDRHVLFYVASWSKVCIYSTVRHAIVHGVRCHVNLGFTFRYGWSEINTIVERTLVLLANEEETE